MAPPQQPPRTPGPSQRRNRPWTWILITAFAGVLVLAGAIVGAAALVSNHSGGSQPPSSQSVKINNNNAEKNGRSQAGPSRPQGGQTLPRGGQTLPQQNGGRGQVVIVPVGQPFYQGQTLQQHVRININNKITIGVKVYYQDGWYVLTGPCHYSPVAGGCTGPYVGTIRPPGYSGGEPKLFRHHPGRPSRHPPTPTTPRPVPTPTPTPTPTPIPTGFLVPSVLARSVATEQMRQLASAPVGVYTSPDNATVTVTCTSLGSNQFSCTGSDSDGDSGAADVVTVAADGSSWSDSGMTWTGPDITGSYTTPAVSGYSG